MNLKIIIFMHFIRFFALFFPLSFISFLNPFKSSFFFLNKAKYCVSSTNTGCLAMYCINQNAGMVRASPAPSPRPPSEKITNVIPAANSSVPGTTGENVRAASL